MFTNQAVAKNAIDNDFIVSLISARDPRGAELLYQSYSRGLLYLAARHCPEYAEDCRHDTVVTSVRQIQEGRLNTPVALPGYLSALVKRIAFKKNTESKKRSGDGETFDALVKSRADERADPEPSFEAGERARFMQQGLQRLKLEQREILARFYLQGEKPEQICQAMQLSATHFRLQKSHAKQILQEFVAQALHHRRPLPKQTGRVL